MQREMLRDESSPHTLARRTQEGQFPQAMADQKKIIRAVPNGTCADRGLPPRNFGDRGVGKGRDGWIIAASSTLADAPAPTRGGRGAHAMIARAEDVPRAFAHPIVEERSGLTPPLRSSSLGPGRSPGPWRRRRDRRT